MFERFTDKARKAMALANQEAQRFNHNYIGTEHILLGLVKEGRGDGALILKDFGADLRAVRLELEKLVKSGPDLVIAGRLPLTPAANRVVEAANQEATELKQNLVGTEHLLLGLLRERDGVSVQVLANLRVRVDELRKDVLRLLAERMATEHEELALSAIPESHPQWDRFAAHPLVLQYRTLYQEAALEVQRLIKEAEYEQAHRIRNDRREPRRRLLDELCDKLETDPGFGLREDHS